MKNIICTLMLVLSLAMLLTACKSDKKEEGDSKPAEQSAVAPKGETPPVAEQQQEASPPPDPPPTTP